MGPPFCEVGECEVRAGTNAGAPERNAERACCGGVVGGERLCRDDAAVLHVTDEDFYSRGKTRDEAAKVLEFTTNTSTEAVVDKDGHLSAAGRDRSDARERSYLIVDLETNVACGEGGWGLGVDCY